MYRIKVTFEKSIYVFWTLLKKRRKKSLKFFMQPRDFRDSRREFDQTKRFRARNGFPIRFYRRKVRTTLGLINRDAPPAGERNIDENCGCATADARGLRI